MNDLFTAEGLQLWLGGFLVGVGVSLMFFWVDAVVSRRKK